jgi:phosphopantothenoylcysteine decarboxylase/phosphopantothenate--cysteine ligase
MGEIDLSGSRLLVGVCGSVSALGVPHLLMWLRTTFGLRGTRIVLTDMAQRFVTKDSLLAVDGCQVMTGWHDLPAGVVSHVDLAEDADVVALLPATANFVAKLANGICDTLLTSVVAAASCPTIVAPSMSEAAWFKPANQRNIKQLLEDGLVVVEPEKGFSTSRSTAEFGSLGEFRRPLLRALLTAQQARKSQNRGGSDGNQL